MILYNIRKIVVEIKTVIKFIDLFDQSDRRGK